MKVHALVAGLALLGACIEPPPKAPTPPAPAVGVSKPLTTRETVQLTDADVAALPPERLYERVVSGADGGGENRAKLVRELCRREQWPDHVAQNIIDRNVWRGATERQLVASWGRTSSRTETVDPSGVQQTWSYSGGSIIVRIDNGIVTGWTNYAAGR